MSFTWRHKHELRTAMKTMLAWNSERVIIAHGRWCDRNGAAELAFRWLRGYSITASETAVGERPATRPRSRIRPRVVPRLIHRTVDSTVSDQCRADCDFMTSNGRMVFAVQQSSPGKRWHPQDDAPQIGRGRKVTSYFCSPLSTVIRLFTHPEKLSGHTAFSVISATNTVAA
jgi:hypothetical protein